MVEGAQMALARAGARKGAGTGRSAVSKERWEQEGNEAPWKGL